MINLLKSLSKGLKEDEISKDFRSLLQDLLILNIIKKTNHTYKFSKNHMARRLDVASNGTGYLEVFDQEGKKDLLIEQKDLNGGSKGDIVVAKRFFTRGKRARAKVVYIAKRAFSHSIVYTKKIDKKIIGVNVKTNLHVNITASQKSLKALPEQSVLKINNETGVIEEVLGVLSDESVDEKISLALYNKKELFSKEAQNQALSYGFEVDKNLYEDYEDLSHLPFCTIDPVDAKDYDDAIFYDEKNHCLYVAIADVSSYVHPFDAIDKEAKQRGFSIYFPHKSIPMLPRNLSENICSLKPNKDRLAFCFKIFLDADNNVKGEELIKCVINSKKRYTYEEIDLFLQGKYQDLDAGDKVVFPWLKALYPISQKLRKKRLENAFEFRSEDLRMRVDENQHLIAVKIEEETPSHALIEDCMLLANKAAAKKIQYGIFRNHESPSSERIEELLADLENIGIDIDFSPELPKLIKNIQKKAEHFNLRADVDKLIIKAQKKALYESQNKGHFGLGFNIYSHFTSPIRRYSDLILHRLLKASIEDNQKLYNYQLENIDTTCENLSSLERESDRVAWDYMDRKFARWASENLGQEFKAIISDIGNTPLAKLDDELKGARLFVIDKDVELLERVMVKIIQSDIASTKILVKITKRLS
ncbi:MAG: ribonuclease R [Proteobacteria bacterium]|nr:MAG: ribonuclease R [Pseudomonadota bacterium]